MCSFKRIYNHFYYNIFKHLWFIVYIKSLLDFQSTYAFLVLFLLLRLLLQKYRLIGPVGRVFGNVSGDLGSIPGLVIPKTLKMVLNTSLLNTQQYKVHIKGKVAPSPTPQCSSYWKGSLLVAPNYGRQLYYLLLQNDINSLIVGFFFTVRVFFSLFLDIILLLLFFTSFFFSFTPALADGLSLESQWQQRSSSLQDSRHYSGRCQQCCRLDGFCSSSNINSVIVGVFLYRYGLFSFFSI